jgi:hypothetical protein
MKEQLLKLLNLPTDMSDEKLVAAVGDLVTKNAELSTEIDELLNAPETDAVKLEKRIQKKIAESGGALNRTQALVAINHQDEALAVAAKAKKKK